MSILHMAIFVYMATQQIYEFINTSIERASLDLALKTIKGWYTIKQNNPS